MSVYPSFNLPRIEYFPISTFLLNMLDLI